jgi:hypothetical protein
MNESRVSDGFLTVLEGDVRGATVELFGAHDITVAHADRVPPLPSHGGPTIVSIIGFVGDTMRGALGLVSTRATILKWQPCLDASEPGVADDVIGEFSNMLAGRLKYKLLQRGVTLSLATPSTSSCPAITMRPPAGLLSRWNRFESPVGVIHVRLDAVFGESFSFTCEPLTLATAAAGDMMLF